MALCDSFLSPDVQAKLLDSLDRSPVDSESPFPFFVLAAKFDRPMLARKAAEASSKNWDQHRHTDLLHWTPKDIDEVGGRYLVALLRTYLSDRQSHTVDWLQFSTELGKLR